MNNDNLQQLKEDVEPKLLEVLNSSNLMDVLQNYDISTEALTLEIKLDTTKLQPNDSSEEQKTRQAEIILLSARRFCPCNRLVDPVTKCCWKLTPP